MSGVLPFRDVLDALDHLSSDEQDALIAIVQKRKTEEARRKLVEEVEQSRKEYRDSKCRTTNIEDLIKEITT